MFLFSDLKPAVRVRSVKLMDWIDSQQWLLQLEDESPHHFLSFPPLHRRLLILLLSSLHLPFFPPPHPASPPVLSFCCATIAASD